MTPARDAIARRNAQRAYDFATAELKQFECPEGVNYLTWIDAPWYRQSREYREWLHEVQRYADYRRRHPIVRRLKDSRSIGPVIRNAHGERLHQFRWHWQNLAEDRPRPARTPCMGPLALPNLSHEGRAWFDWIVNPDTSTRPFKWRIEWYLGTAARDLAFRFSHGDSYEGDGDLGLHLSVPYLFNVYVTLCGVLPGDWEGKGRDYGFSFLPREDWYLSWEWGHIETGEWRRDDPENWRKGSVFLLDTIFGRATCTTEKIGAPVQAVACFPEGQYALTLQRETRTWKRPRWPWPYVRHFVDITLDRPPGFQGKGENSYDCGPDAIYGMSSDGHSFEDAVATYVKAVLRERRKRGTLAPEHRTILTEAAS